MFFFFHLIWHYCFENLCAFAAMLFVWLIQSVHTDMCWRTMQCIDSNKCKSQWGTCPWGSASQGRSAGAQKDFFFNGAVWCCFGFPFGKKLTVCEQWQWAAVARSIQHFTFLRCHFDAHGALDTTRMCVVLQGKCQTCQLCNFASLWIPELFMGTLAHDPSLLLYYDVVRIPCWVRCLWVHWRNDM